jgi:hypothetical protein
MDCPLTTTVMEDKAAEAKRKYAQAVKLTEDARKLFGEVKRDRLKRLDFTKQLAIFMGCDNAFVDEIRRDEDGRTYVMYNGQLIRATHDGDMVDNTVVKHIFIKKGNSRTMRNFTNVLGNVTYASDTNYAYIGRVVTCQIMRARTATGDRASGRPLYKMYIDTTRPLDESDALDAAFYNVWKDIAEFKVKLTALLTYGLEPVTNKISDGIIPCMKRAMV